MSARQRLPNRRPAHTETFLIDGQASTATVGFDPESGQPRELFLMAGKEGSMLNSLLADAAVVISIALQHGIPAAALAKSIGRLPSGPVTPADLEGAELTLASGSRRNSCRNATVTSSSTPATAVARSASGPISQN